MSVAGSTQAKEAETESFFCDTEDVWPSAQMRVIVSQVFSKERASVSEHQCGL